MKPEPLRIHPIALLSGLFLLAGCDKPAVVEDFLRPMVMARGRDMPELVFAANAPELDPGGVPFIEAVRHEEAWQIHNEDRSSAPCRSDEEIHAAVDGMRTKHADQRIVISAAANTSFADIRTMVRGAAMAGFSRVDFLVSTPSRRRRNHAFPLQLPVANGIDVLPEIEPMLVSLDGKGHIFIGSGPNRTLMSADPEDRELAKLDGTLALYSAAAQAASCQPLCSVYVDAAAPYQRVIDMLSRFHEYKITQLAFTDLVEHPATSCEGMNFDHKERMDLLKNKPRPSPPSSQPRMPDL